MIYFISEFQNGMIVKEEVTNPDDLGYIIDHHRDNEIYKRCIMYIDYDNVPVAINVLNISDGVIEGYQRMHWILGYLVEIWFNLIESIRISFIH